jgi:tungstate transport system substrate-binding protein
MIKRSLLTHARKFTVLITIALLVLLPACQQAAADTTSAVNTSIALTSSQADESVPETTSMDTTAAITEPVVTKPENPIVRLSTTTSINDSGLLPVLEEIFEKNTGYDLEIIANGTGAAIKLGESGDADVLLVHAKASEEEFVTAGYGVERIPFMHNYFVIAGAAEDTAKVAECQDALSAFAAIADAEAPFISRGDDSGTNKAELKIWENAGITPSGDWYISAGKGMGPCLIMAGEMKAYILTDKATFLATKAQTELQICLGESDDLKNTYSLIAVNPDKNPGVNSEGAEAWINFMLSDEAGAIITDFGQKEYGEPLFFYDGAPSIT